jgi:hypothetical protein
MVYRSGRGQGRREFTPSLTHRPVNLLRRCAARDRPGRSRAASARPAAPRSSRGPACAAARAHVPSSGSGHGLRKGISTLGKRAPIRFSPSVTYPPTRSASSKLRSAQTSSCSRRRGKLACTRFSASSTTACRRVRPLSTTSWIRPSALAIVSLSVMVLLPRMRSPLRYEPTPHRCKEFAAAR